MVLSPLIAARHCEVAVSHQRVAATRVVCWIASLLTATMLPPPRNDREAL
ncbi:MAG: hypothetical protein LBT00_11160 [Spirochaetaceae bacterium]|nr:hypothetical protein [Spirochaetaceae bacterium]